MERALRAAMISPLRLFVFRSTAALLLMAGLWHGDLRAQSAPPRPAVALSQLPRFFSSTIPADFNEDGHPDLIGAASNNSGFPVPPDLVVALGRGDGTFAPAQSLDVAARPLAVGDFNGDGHADVVIDGLAILPGRGDGTFRAARTIDSSGASSDVDVIAPRAVAADFNGDGKLDFVVVDHANLYVYPGRGDFTFDARVALPVSDGALAIVVGDFNHDGRPDIAATVTSQRVDVFLNHGGLVFSVTSVPIADVLWDIDAGDLNKDGATDLIVASSSGVTQLGEGHYYVLLGNGNGTFQPAVAHATGANGALTVAVNDFNHDGSLDVAIGNRSFREADTACSGFTYWDSVTIAPGLGTGDFGAPSTFRLGTSNGDELYRNTHNALATADLNGDGWPDLVTSPGAILLAHAPSANHTPIVNAGPDQVLTNGDPDVHFDAIASDADNDWLEFEWRDGTGAVVGRWPHFCGGAGPGTYTVTVSDGHGGVGTDSMTMFPRAANDLFVGVAAPIADETVSVQAPYTIRFVHANDAAVASYRVLSSTNNGQTFAAVGGCANLPPSATSCVWSNPGPVSTTARVQVEAYDAASHRLTFATTDRFQIVSGPPSSLPAGWLGRDVGRVGEPGSATFNGTSFTISGSGSDIWGTADEFHWAFTFMSGDFDVVARVTSVQNINQWTKAGLMIREQLAAGARHASVFATPTTAKGTAFQRRPTMDGISVSTAGPSATPFVWLRLSRTGDVVSAFWRSGDNGAWTPIGTQTFASLADSVQIGLAVSSHVHGTLASATFDHVSIAAASLSSSGWSSEDVGAVGAAGNSTVPPGGTATVTGSGADIWGTADAFHWVYQPVSGNFTIDALVDSVDNVNRWTKAGLMIRANHDAGSQHASLFATPTTQKGVAFQGREISGGPSIQQSSVAAAPSVWIRLTREGDTIEAFIRKDRTNQWVNLGLITLPDLPSSVLVGFAVSSHVDATLATAHFSNIDLERLPDWAEAQIGPGTFGESENGTFFSLSSQGRDIWGTSDDFGYVYTPWNGDGTITARLTDLRAADPWSKGGVMFRESLAPGSKHAFAFSAQSFEFGAGSKGLAEQYRPATNGPSASGGSDPGEPPIFDQAKPLWIRLTRAGNIFSSSVSYDGVTFKPLGTATVAMPASILVGLAVTSHNVNEAAQGLYDEVRLRR
jgi:regulation of enolase protein 1 (concanavalin A-like superfamily)